MEIERKYLVSRMPENIERYDFSYIEQGYICRDPVLRIRHCDDRFILTYKGEGMLAREEVNIPITEAGFAALWTKIDGTVIKKLRYYIPLEDGLTAELDIFEMPRRGLVIVEVEFPDLETSERFTPPDWFGPEVTNDPFYHNSNM